MLVLVGKRVIEFLARPPKKFEAQLPRRVGDLVKLLRPDAEELVQEVGQDDGRPLADADDADVRRPDDADAEGRHLQLQRQRRHEPGAAAAEDDNLVDLP